MHVSDILQAKGREVATIDQGETVAAAIALLAERRIGAVVVTGPRPPFAGIFSERDAIWAIAASGGDALDLPVGKHMTDEVTVCQESTDLLQVLATMTARRFRHIPVVEDGQLVGIVSIGDVVKARLDELETEKRELLDYVSAR